MLKSTPAAIGRSFKLWFVAIISSQLIGCAGVRYASVPVEVASVNATAEEKKAIEARNRLKDQWALTPGIRYYDTSIYLLVYADGIEKIKWQLMELPDQTKLRIAGPYNFGSELQSTLHFKDGVLVRAQEKVDSTKVPKAIIEAIGELAPLLLGAAFDARKTDHQVPAPHLYKLVQHNGEYVLMGGPATDDAGSKVNIRVSLKPPTP